MKPTCYKRVKDLTIEDIDWETTCFTSKITIYKGKYVMKNKYFEWCEYCKGDGSMDDAYGENIECPDCGGHKFSLTQEGKELKMAISLILDKDFDDIWNVIKTIKGIL